MIKKRVINYYDDGHNFIIIKYHFREDWIIVFLALESFFRLFIKRRRVIRIIVKRITSVERIDIISCVFILKVCYSGKDSLAMLAENNLLS